MSLRVHDTNVEREIRRNRESVESGHRDEVWDGVYIVMPDPNIEHQHLIGQLITILTITIAWARLGRVQPGGNISDRLDDWTRNYRIPDVAVYLNDTRAYPHDAFWFGGPDFAIEIVSPDDLSREKLPFYAKVGTREVLVIDRDPWALELYRLHGEQLVLTGISKPESAASLASEVIPLSFRVIEGTSRPLIEVKDVGSNQTWTI